VEELGWAAIPVSYDPDELAFRKEKIGDRALVVGYECGKLACSSLPEIHSIFSRKAT
jgi:hypothetical protein